MHIRAQGINSAETWMEKMGKGRKHLEERQRHVEEAAGDSLTCLLAGGEHSNANSLEVPGGTQI